MDAGVRDIHVSLALQKGRVSMAAVPIAASSLWLLSRATPPRVLRDRAALRVRLNLMPRHGCAQAQTRIATAQMGLGAAILPRLALPGRISKNRRTCAICSPPLRGTVGLWKVRGRRFSPTAELLARMIRLYAAEVARDAAPPRP
jgi:hypothetical protein